MLIKEYRIALPLSVEEYRIAQLYMIQKKSREESSGAGSGVEILVNEPYTDGPGGSGQYTQKIYHIGSHLPGWFRSILPKSALRVEEEAWNAYPYTKTIYRCPFIEKFSLEIETVYLNDGGEQENVFNLSDSALRSRIVDYMDIVKDPVGGDYHKEEDPRIYVSEKTDRGPLTENWRQDYIAACKDPNNKTKAIMCAYKLCKVEFKYWGMQTKIERFIHDVGLRKTMVRAHRQAWCWQDEYHGLTIDDIRQLERQTQLALQETMANALAEGEEGEEGKKEEAKRLAPEETKQMEEANGGQAVQQEEDEADKANSLQPAVTNRLSMASSSGRRGSWGSARSRFSGSGSRSLRGMESIERLHVNGSESDDEFFDAQGMSSLEARPSWLVSFFLYIHHSPPPSLCPLCPLPSCASASDDGTSPLGRRLEQYNKSQGGVDSLSAPTSSLAQQQTVCKTTILFMVLHGGSTMDSGQDPHLSKHSDISTFRQTIETVLHAHYPAMLGHIAMRIVTCPSICAEALSLLSSLNPFTHDVSSPTADSIPVITNENFPVSVVPLFATQSANYYDSVVQVITRANSVYNDFLRSEDGLGFNGQVCLIGDSVGSMLAYDALCRANPFLSRASSQSGEACNEDSAKKHSNLETIKQRHASCPNSRRTSTGSQEGGKFEFDVSDFFMFGSPLGAVLAHRKVCHASGGLPKPSCAQIYNMFYSMDPAAIRLEPLIQEKFKLLAPMKIPRYQKFPLGDGQSIHFVESVQGHSEVLLRDSSPCKRRHSAISTSSEVAGGLETLHSYIASLSSTWWGSKRLDFALYCPEGLQSFPAVALPYLLHASFWESTDVAAFILRQVVRQEYVMTASDASPRELHLFSPTQPREKWLKRRTTIKVKNVAPNHRANDVIVVEDGPQSISARFMYGPLDMVSLSGEKVDVHILTSPPAGDYVYFGTEVSDSNGRVCYQVPQDKRLTHGMYPVKMVVRGDHTSVDFYLAILPPKTETVVFSIDGSFTASVSIMGKDPKVRAGAVDVVRHWQELGFLIVYVSARPDMQQKKVVAWLAQHNFPHGMVSFMDGLSADPLRQKANYLKTLCNEAKLEIHAAYGSSKDISVYSSVGMTSDQIFIVGKSSKKNCKEANMISEGYASHLALLSSSPSISRPAQGNARLFLRKSCFSLPGQMPRPGSKRPVRKSCSLPYKPSAAKELGKKTSLQEPASILISESGNTLVAGGGPSASRARGFSPRPKLSTSQFDSTDI
ncbi:hypothetical protein CAPTEDRAFT_169194 [Capitella teleta]|uniref:DDHD domain-containing protein n=1 Tax=Capitella teleta TaxID=283909 RepID=R7V5K0_CAPTE|nr:hypothetical protein CAPTEDRAFT_169194 [Capitella teleta]|eukprot:ELU13727.1 hypothetical protein CAPTEDRAFT_169194 [Capitella teleta]